MDDERHIVTISSSELLTTEQPQLGIVTDTVPSVVHTTALVQSVLTGEVPRVVVLSEREIHVIQVGGGGSGVADHGLLTGLSDNDHPQYLLVADIDDTPVNGEVAQPISSNWAFDHMAAADPHPGYLTQAEGDALYSVLAHNHDHGGLTGLSDNDHPQYLLVADIDDVPVNGELAQPISSNWAFDHLAAADPHPGYLTQAEGDALYSVLAHNHDHGALTGLADDDHTQYHTDARALTWLGTRSTADLPEGSNLYFTDERVDDRVAALLVEGTGIDLAYVDGSGTLTITADLSELSTSTLPEGTNLYFTNERVDDRVDALFADNDGVSWTYDDGAGTFTIELGTITPDNVVTEDLTVNGDSILGSASDDALTIAPSTVTWSNNPTHSGQHTFTGNVITQASLQVNSSGSGSITGSPMLWVRNGDTGGLPVGIGSDVAANTLTNATIKRGQIASPHYTNAEEAVTTAFMQNTSTANQLSLGGGTSGQNAATLVRLYTAPDNTTLTGTAQLTLDGPGALATISSALTVTGQITGNLTGDVTGTVSSLANHDTADLAEGTNLYFTDERAQDAVGGILVDGTTINFTYNDATPSVTAEVIQSALDHGSIGGLSDNDHPQYLLVADIDDTPVNGEVAQPISSNWAFDHLAAADPHPGYLTQTEGDALYLSASTSSTQTGYFGDIKLKDDTSPSHYLTITDAENLTADRILSLVTGDAARTITLSGNPTLADWFDQSVKVAASPTFAGLTLSGLTSGRLALVGTAGLLQDSATFTYTSAANDYSLALSGSSTNINFIEIENSGTGGSLLLVDAGSVGDAAVRFVTGAPWSIGSDQSAGDTFVISASSALGTTDWLRISTTGIANFLGSLDVDGTLNVDSTSNFEGAMVVDDTLNVTGAVDLDSTLNVDGAGQIDGVLTVGGAVVPTGSPRLVVADGTMTAIFGADASATTLTDATQKATQLGFPHYTNAQEAVAILLGSVTDVASSLSWGGGTALMNATMSHSFYTAADTVTTTGTRRMYIDSLGGVYIGDTTNASATIGLTINQDGNDNEIFSLKSSDVAHGLTSITETDTYGYMQKISATTGGLGIVGLAESTATAGLYIVGFGGTAVTTPSTTARAFAEVYGYQTSGTNVANATANAIVFNVRSWVGGAGRTLLCVDEDGDLFLDGAAGAAFDDWDDISLLRALETERAPGKVRAARHAPKTAYSREDLARAKLMPIVEEGEPLMNVSQIQRLQTGAFWQMYEEMEDLKARVKQLER